MGSTMHQKQKKTLLRVVIAILFVVLVTVVYTISENTHSWFWLWPLAIALVFYNWTLWGKRCPTCREDFALEPQSQGTFMTLHRCRDCGATCTRPNQGGVPGGGGP